MSILVRPPKRKLDELDGFDPQERRISRGSHAQPFEPQPSRSPDTIARRATSYGSVESHRSSEQLDTSGDLYRHGPSLREPPSGRASPVFFDGPFQSQKKFIPNASIVLIGIRGTGKSSLAVILAATSGRRLIDAGQYFQQATGRSRAEYKRDFGLAEYRQQEVRIMESMLEEHKEGWVIACGPGSMERRGQMLLREYAKTHPVVHIIRDFQSIQSYLNAWNKDKVHRFLELSGPIYRACSNFEFFNVDEKGSGDPVLGKDGHQNTQLGLELDQRSETFTPFLTLKRLQRDFLRFIAFAIGDATYLRKQHTSFPLSMRPVETRMYSYAAVAPLSSLLERKFDIEDLETAADAFELRIDVTDGSSSQLGVDSSLADRISQTVATIRRNIIVPVIYHVESKTNPNTSPTQHNEASCRPDTAYLNLVQHGLRLAPGFLTIDLSYDDGVLSQIISSKGTSKVIGHFEALQRPSEGWDDPQYLALYERAKKLGCDMVRLIQPAESIEDNFAVQRFRHHVKSIPGEQTPLIAYNSGPLGRLSCCFNPILSPVIHQSLMPDVRAKRLPCITLREAQEALYSSFALDPMQFFVFGANTTYSLSPAMHNAAYKLCGLPHRYNIHQSSSLRGLNDLVENPHFGGTSVSLPYKTEAIPLLHSMSPHARAIGAVNTLIPIRGDIGDRALNSEDCTLYMERSRAGPIKALHGDNTDWIGICNCFRRGLSPANAIRPSSTGLVIGAGGMARAAVYSMIHLGVQNIFIYNRTAANAERLAYHYNRQTLHTTGKSGSAAARPTFHILHSSHDTWPAAYKQPTVICSCIPAHSIGGQPAPNTEMPIQWLESPTGGVVVDLAYKPLNTPLMKQIRALSHRGWVALDGLDVLPEQGFAQFELFTGRRAPRRVMRTVVLQEYRGEEGQYDPRAIQSRLESLDGQPT
ncbi:putative quinate pathway repressor protein QutR [Aspergillus steynii IBT 23096]|uniref:Putative quinate pathway repressor protein QutR n=1 Tax=Aspergillus steynii IBT 23096 TaxID=1392250 RepID=A0A2I2FSZ5_9EURO|nr:putative quinate pathway repressor protein QutR [Aspergillus steynii IBT 23096]PLB43736.1 putative quinate pathway repressor protein QutR [Aspergillus steynii IBT 23096]